MTQLIVIACLAFDHRAPTDGLQRFKACILQCPQVERAMEVCGTFDLIIQGRCSDVAEFNSGMERLRAPLSLFVTRIETSFVARTMDRPAQENESGSLWLPCKDGRRRVEYRQIDKIVAEGDYMRVHVGEWNCLVHHTMAKLREQLTSPEFIRLRRSCLVRTGFIERLTHEGRRWTARLKDGTHVPIAQTSVAQVVRLIAGESSSVRRASSKGGEHGPTAESSNEIQLKVPT